MMRQATANTVFSLVLHVKTISQLILLQYISLYFSVKALGFETGNVFLQALESADWVCLFSPGNPGWGLDKEAMLNVSSLDI